MSKLDKILNDVEWRKDDNDELARVLSQDEAKQAIKDLIQELVDETFDAKDAKALEFWQKVEAL
jgi:glutamate synthase domain-containing protein 3